MVFTKQIAAAKLANEITSHNSTKPTTPPCGSQWQVKPLQLFYLQNKTWNVMAATRY